MRAKSPFNLWLLCLLLIPIGVNAESGISLDSYGEVLVENLAIGESYSMMELMNLPMVVTYKGETPSHLLLRTRQPRPAELKKGFEAIPDAGWISLGNTKVAITANSSYRTDVKISIPRNTKYLGKKYQAAFMASLFSSKKSVVSVSSGVIGRFLFTVAEMENPLRSSTNLSVNLNFKYVPGMLELENVALGKKVKILTKDNVPVKLKNFSNKKNRYSIVSINPQDTIQTIYKDYEACPDPEFLRISKEEITIAAGNEKPIKMWLEIPDEPTYRNKKYQFAISTSGIEKSTTGAIYMRILVNTAK